MLKGSKETAQVNTTAMENVVSVSVTKTHLGFQPPASAHIRPSQVKTLPCPLSNTLSPKSTEEVNSSLFIILKL